MRLTGSQAEVRPPYGCVICGGDVGLVDTLYELDAYPGWEKNGAIYLCSPCIATAAGTLGMESKANYDALAAVCDEYAAENAILREKHLEDVDAVIAAVKERLATPARARKATTA